MRVASILFLGVLAGAAAAQETPVEVRYLSTEAWRHEETIVIRGAFEIAGPAHRWYDVYYQLRLSADEPLHAPGQQGMAKRWDSLFTPETPSPARWTDCRAGFPLAEIAAAENLPRGAKTRIWAVCDVWDQTAKAYVGSGWSVAIPIDLETDAQGGIVSVGFPGSGAAEAPAARPIHGMWTFTFPGGAPHGTCAFSEDGHWAWTIYEGTEVKTTSQGTWTLERDVLTLSHEDGVKQEYRLEWAEDRKFLLSRGGATLTFTR